MRKILAVDDSPVVLKMVERTLRSLGFEPVTAENGQEGLKRFEEYDIALIVTDLNMPVMNGIDFIRALRKQNTSTPILILTTESDPELMKEAREIGADGWLEKPPLQSELREYIERLLPKPAEGKLTAYPIL